MLRWTLGCNVAVTCYARVTAIGQSYARPAKLRRWQGATLLRCMLHAVTEVLRPCEAFTSVLRPCYAVIYKRNCYYVGILTSVTYYLVNYGVASLLRWCYADVTA